MNVCVYGGGNIAHSLAAKISSTQSVTVITRRPASWARRLTFEQGGNTVESRYDVVATDDVGVAATADVIFIALPQFATDESIDVLSRVMKRGATVVFTPAPSSTESFVRQLSAIGVNAIGYQRVPYISRIIEYGKRVSISIDRAVHRVAFSDASQFEPLSDVFSHWFGGSVSRLSSFLTFVFNNSNPLLHSSRMVVLFRNWRERSYPVNPPFYAEWTDESSELYIAADREMLSVLRAVDPSGACERDYEPVLTHYGVVSAKELTEKIRSIESFKKILSPMVLKDGLWLPDFSSRYFEEDVDVGLSEIVKRSRLFEVSSPVLEGLLTAMSEIRRS